MPVRAVASNRSMAIRRCHHSGAGRAIRGGSLPDRLGAQVYALPWQSFKAGRTSTYVLPLTLWPEHDQQLAG